MPLMPDWSAGAGFMEGTTSWTEGVDNLYQVALCTSSLTPATTMRFMSDITNELSGGNYARADLTTRALSYEAATGRLFWDADDAVFASLAAAAGTPAWAVVHRKDQIDPQSPIICFIELVDFPTPDGSNYTIPWKDGHILWIFEDTSGDVKLTPAGTFQAMISTFEITWVLLDGALWVAFLTSVVADKDTKMWSEVSAYEDATFPRYEVPSVSFSGATGAIYRSFDSRPFESISGTATSPIVQAVIIADNGGAESTWEVVSVIDFDAGEGPGSGITWDVRFYVDATTPNDMVAFQLPGQTAP